MIIPHNFLPGTVFENQNVFTEQVYNHIKSNEVSELTTLLLTYGYQLNLLEMKDAKNFTVLSFSAYKNSEECFILLFNHALEYNFGYDNKIEEPNISFEEKKKLLT